MQRMTQTMIGLFGLTIGAAAACTQDAPSTVDSSGETSMAEIDKTSAPVPLDALVPASDANRDFAARLFARLVDEASAANDNIVYSPLSMQTAFGMLHEGARGATAVEIQQVFGFAGDATSTPSRGALLTALAERAQPANDDNTLRVVNQIWMQQDYPFHDAFLQATSGDYGAAMKSCDFVRDADAERVRINDWVAEQTEQRIEDLLPQGSTDRNTRLVLTNAVYFLGKWAEPFDEGYTTDRAFHKAGGETVDVPTMFRNARMASMANDAFAAVELPFAGDDLSMVVMLPAEGTDASAIADGLPAWLDQLDGLRAQQLRLFLPRFEFDASYDLVETLGAMGMPLAFDVDNADLTGLSPRAADDDLYVSGAFHKAFIKVDEAGAEAAAATGVVAGVRSALPTKPAEMRVDRPFVVVIRDTETQAILFLGLVNDPA